MVEITISQTNSPGPEGLSPLASFRMRDSTPISQMTPSTAHLQKNNLTRVIFGPSLDDTRSPNLGKILGFEKGFYRQTPTSNHPFSVDFWRNFSCF